jgi:hypothetical protein
MKKFENSHVNASGVYPDAVPVDASGPSATDGTEYVALGIGEKWGWMQALLNETGIAPSGNTELSGPGNSDIVKALKTLIGGRKIQPVDVSLAANAMTITLSPTYLDFRSATLGSGVINNRLVETAITLVISSGSTLGTVSGQQSRIAVLAIDNAGTVELAAVNLAGGNNLDETDLISTVAEGGAGAADSNNVFYSTTLRSNVPYKVVGYIESTQATAGAWATAPSTIQGCGGQAFSAMSSIGYGQTWQDVIGSRVVGTTYYNTTGKPIQITVSGTQAGIGGHASLSVNGVAIQKNNFPAGGGDPTAPLTAIIPIGASYQVDSITNVFTPTEWFELR